MKFFTLLVSVSTLVGCVTADPPIPLDDPRWARAEKRYEGSLVDASGITALSIVGLASDSEFADVFYDPLYTNSAEIAAAPTLICAYLNGTVTSANDKPHPSPEFYPDARVLEVHCAT